MSHPITPKFRSFIQDVKNANYKVTVEIIHRWQGEFDGDLLSKIIFAQAEPGLIRTYVDQYLEAPVAPEAFA